MSGDRFVVVGLARVRSPWFAEVAQWAGSAELPIEFLKCVSAAEASARLGSGRAVSALLVDAGISGADRDLLDHATAAGAAAVVVGDGHRDRDWVRLGATATLPEDFDPATLLAVLGEHARPIRPATGSAIPAASDAGSPSTWRGRMVVVTGASGAGVSTVAMALAQGLAGSVGGSGSVALADLAGCGDLAMYHHVGDVVPGLQELVEAHRTGAPTRAELGQLMFDIEDRGYSLLLGLRRSRDWTALRPKALAASLESLRASFRLVVADVRAEFDGEQETGSVDVEERNGASRLAVSTADVVVVCGDATLKGIHGLVRCERDLGSVAVDARRVVRVVNRAPAVAPAPRRHRGDPHRVVGPPGHRIGTVFLPARRHLDVVHSVADRLPSPLVDPITRAVAQVVRSGEAVP